MARTRGVNKRKNLKTNQRKNSFTNKSKSKYFNKPVDIGVKRNVKLTSEQEQSDSKKSGINLPEFDVLSSEAALKECITDCYPPMFGKRLLRDFYNKTTEMLAVALLGKVLCRKTEQGTMLCGKIVETEAYPGITDSACHAYEGKRTARNAPMYAPPGTTYVYFIYGMYYCFNISSQEAGACVLIRALEPFAGLADMRQLRGEKRKETSKPLKDHELANGPSKLCTALDITKGKLNNTDMVLSNLCWIEDTSLAQSEKFSVVHTTRIGIKKGADKLYRYYILGNKHVSIRDRDAEKQLA